MKRIAYENWPRREIFEFFSGLSNPFYSVTFRLDVTGLYEAAREKGISFYYALVYLSSKAVNSVEALRYTIEGGEVMLLDERIPSFTDLKKGAEAFHIVTMPAEGSMEAFCTAAREKSQRQERFIDEAAQGGGLIYLSCLPWVELTALTNERDLDADDAIPRLAWGKYREENGRKILGYSVELNHRFADGVHVGMFAKELERLIEELSTDIGR